MMNKMIIFALIAALVAPALSFAKTGETFETSGWIPYWRAERGIANILPQLDKFTEVNPFIYTVRQDGSLYLNVDLQSSSWTTLRTKSKEMGVRYIPTITWGSGDAIDAILSNDAARAEHVRAITREVFARGFDGIDIDYEGKMARTRPFFSLFLKELQEAVGYDKWVMCTIEARTPLDSRYSTPESIPKDIEYANDFKEINKYCDRVRIMAYDQGRFDLKLNDANADPYVPVADRAWVLKVMKLTAEEIDKSKLMIGVATYGYEHDMFPATDGSGDMSYSQLWSFNPGYALEIAQKLNLTPTRNSAGELMITFTASQSPEPSIPLPSATRVLTWSDGEAIRQKAELAKQLGVRGVSIFKIDDGQDAGVWGVLAAHHDKTPNASGLAVTPGAAEERGAVAGASASNMASAAAAITLSVPTRDLEYGLRIEEVRALQKLLNAYGFTVATSGGGSPGNETIFFGPATRAALINFQKANNVTPSVGYYGPKTRAAFLHLSSR